MSISIAFPEFEPGTVWLVGAGPGDVGLLTLTARHGLETADVILHGALVDPAILCLAGTRARLVDVGKRASRHSPKQMTISEMLIAEARAGNRVLRLKGGDPMVFGRGGEEALALAAAEIRFRLVPGITAGIAGPGEAGVPITHRNLSQSVAFVTGTGAAGGPPRHIDWERLAQGVQTIVVFMGRRHWQEVAAGLIKGGRSPHEPVRLIAGAGSEDAVHLTSDLAGTRSAFELIDPDLPVLFVVGKVTELASVIGPWQQVGPARIAREMEPGEVAVYSPAAMKQVAAPVHAAW